MICKNGSITLVGMSNVGKSYWARALAALLGFEHLCCDDAIERVLDPEIKRFGFTGGIVDVAKWMGLPYEPQSPANQQRYLEIEGDVTAEAIEQVIGGKQFVLDATGSVVYLTSKILTTLRDRTTVVYLCTPSDRQQELFARFIVEPKPVIWGKAWQPHEEFLQQALTRCYSELLAWRSEQYAKLAHVTVPWSVHRRPGLTARELLDYVDDVLTAQNIP